MKIDYAIVSCDDNKLYSEFWEPVKKLWFELIGIKPLLVKISNNNEIHEYNDCIIHNLKKVDGVDTGFQSQIARMYVTQFYQDKVCLTSDIDMLPLSKKYFVDNIEKYNEENLIILSSDAYKNINRYPICYNAAKGKLFKEILNLPISFEEYVFNLKNYNQGWDTDELYFGFKVNSYFNQDKIVKLNRGWENGRATNRIDRVNWNYNLNKLKSFGYIDSHSLRPYNVYFNEINRMLDNIFD